MMMDQTGPKPLLDLDAVRQATDNAKALALAVMMHLDELRCFVRPQGLFANDGLLDWVDRAQTVLGVVQDQIHDAVKALNPGDV